MSKKPSAGGSSGGKSGGKDGKSGDSGSSDKSSSDGSKSADASDSLYKGYMTGWSYEAIRNLMFFTKEGEARGPSELGKPTSYADRRDNLVEWIYTYLNIVTSWGADGLDDVTDDLKQLVEEVEGVRNAKDTAGKKEGDATIAKDKDAGQPTATFAELAGKLSDISAKLNSLLGTSTPPAQPPETPPEHPAPVTLEAFDSDFERVVGAVRAKAPYAYYAVLFGQYADRLQHPRYESTPGSKGPVPESGKAVSGILIQCLSELKNFLPDGAYEVVYHDLGDIYEAGKVRPDEQPDNAQAWADLIFGTATPRDLLNWKGRLAFYGSLIGAAMGLAFVAGLIVLFVVLAANLGLSRLTGVKLTDLTSITSANLSTAVATITTGLTTIGITLSTIGTKAWSWFQAYEKWAAVQLAKAQWLRGDVYISAGSLAKRKKPIIDW